MTIFIETIIMKIKEPLGYKEKKPKTLKIHKQQ